MPGYAPVVTFDEKTAGTLVAGDQIVRRGGSRLSVAQMFEITSVERSGGDVLVSFRRGSAPVRYPASTLVVVLPKVERDGWWVQA